MARDFPTRDMQLSPALSCVIFYGSASQLVPSRKSRMYSGSNSPRAVKVTTSREFLRTSNQLIISLFVSPNDLALDPSSVLKRISGWLCLWLPWPCRRPVWPDMANVTNLYLDIEPTLQGGVWRRRRAAPHHQPVSGYLSVDPCPDICVSGNVCGYSQCLKLNRENDDPPDFFWDPLFRQTHIRDSDR